MLIILIFKTYIMMKIVMTDTTFENRVLNAIMAERITIIKHRPSGSSLSFTGK